MSAPAQSPSLPNFKVEIAGIDALVAQAEGKGFEIGTYLVGKIQLPQPGPIDEIEVTLFPADNLVYGGLLPGYHMNAALIAQTGKRLEAKVLEDADFPGFEVRRLTTWPKPTLKLETPLTIASYATMLVTENLPSKAKGIDLFLVVYHRQDVSVHGTLVATTLQAYKEALQDLVNGIYRAEQLEAPQAVLQLAASRTRATGFNPKAVVM